MGMSLLASVVYCHNLDQAALNKIIAGREGGEKQILGKWRRPQYDVNAKYVHCNPVVYVANALPLVQSLAQVS